MNWQNGYCGQQKMWSEAEERLYAEVIEELDFSRELTDGEVEDLLDEIICRRGREMGLTAAQREQIQHKLFNRLRRLDVLQELLEDPEITEVMVNGPENIFVERNGVLYPSDRKFLSRERLEDVIQQIVSGVNRVVNESSPIVDARLKDGSRVNVVLSPVAIDGPALTIRKFARNVWSLHQLAERKMLTTEAADFLERMVVQGANLFVSGGTGTGKTTFLNALACAIPPRERVVLIEDSAELKISQPNLVRLEMRNANGEGTHSITIRELIRTSLRMRPDRIIVGEVRDGACMDMLAAMNTGHAGSLSTGHGNSPQDMLSRLETMALMGASLPLPAIRAQIGSALNFMVHLSRDREGERRVVSIVEVRGYDRDKDKIRVVPIFAFSEESRRLEKVADPVFCGN
ncbi:MAG: CpaF family protein [Lachnospiraceae bacterium]|nr:CpaF family protein [Lachnospiraceae bacterium]